ncbi:hypothetical protein BGZ57DRAFT_999943 [Hyaloscypha finlandica]|nr:hypothetical protein BGZ57DRAFT_999943 [Hyaloscypha finlandica]
MTRFSSSPPSVLDLASSILGGRFKLVSIFRHMEVVRTVFIRGNINSFSRCCSFPSSVLPLSCNMMFWRALPAIVLLVLFGLLGGSSAATMSSLKATEAAPAPPFVPPSQLLTQQMSPELETMPVRFASLSAPFEVEPREVLEMHAGEIMGNEVRKLPSFGGRLMEEEPLRWPEHAPRISNEQWLQDDAVEVSKSFNEERLRLRLSKQFQTGTL